MKFTYASGKRPLDGYTIKRGVGKGGFGEVYFALSDGGKEVALKVLRGDHADVELRGIRQCLNLKHQNLVALFDVREDSDGQAWVIMEYIAGETLSSILNRHPRGLPQELIQQWFPALCRAVGYLHDHGIVHRDLKPANIFLEHGILKVGDYGLSKSMSASHRSAQTSSVGTVHYMAPEISSGNYNKSVDIYALGVILFEMLTGAPPFEGESAQEVMMKHLMALPDLGKVPPALKSVLAKALAKDPNQRHATAAELVKDVESVFGEIPQALPVDAPMKRVAMPDPKASPKPQPVGRAIEVPVKPSSRHAVPVVSVDKPGEALSALPFTLRDKSGELAGSMTLAVLLAAVASVLLAALRVSKDLTSIGQFFFYTVGVSWAVLIPTKFWSGKPGNEWIRRLVLTLGGVTIGLIAMWLDGWTLQGTGLFDVAANPSRAGNAPGLPALAGYVSYFGLALGLLRWWKATDRRRDSWFSFFPILTAGIWGFILLIVWPDAERPFGIPALVLASMIVQWVSPWQAPPPQPPKRAKLRR